MGSIKIVVFGNAVTAGTSAKLDVFYDCCQYGTTTVNMVRETQTWHSIMARILSDWVESGVEVINAGCEGGNSSKGLVSKAPARLEREVFAHSPDYVLVMFGTGDALACTEPGTFREELEKIVDEIAAQNDNPVLMTPTPISERMTAGGGDIYELRRCQERLFNFTSTVRSIAEERSLPMIDLNRYFMSNGLEYDHLFEGCLPDGVAQSGMASFIAGELLPMLGVHNFPNPILCDYLKVYTNKSNPDYRHNAWTNLTYFEGVFYIGFHTGSAHAADGGAGIVLKSVDGITWEKEAVLEVENVEKIWQPDFLQVGNSLFAYTVTAVGRKTARQQCTTYGFERLGPGEWSKPFKCAPGFFWHSIKWRDNFYVSSWDYAKDPQYYGVKLFKSDNGRSWEEISTILDYNTNGNETDLLVENDKLIAYSRAGNGSNDETQISTYIPEENRWETISTGRIIQGPCVFKTQDRIILSGRYCSQSDDRFRELREDWKIFTGQAASAESAGIDPARIEEYHHGLRTGIFVMDGTRPRLVMELLSAGDCGYPGVVQYGDEYVISDYSMHEYYPASIKCPGDWKTPCDIYISRIRFGK